jgi:hypothetical protein
MTSRATSFDLSMPTLVKITFERYTVEILGPKLVSHIRFQKFLRNLKAHVCEPM